MRLVTEPTRSPLLGEPLPIELMNTIWADRTGVHDALASPPEVLAWIRAIAPRLDASAALVVTWADNDAPVGIRKTADNLRQLRDAMRRLASEVTDDPREAAASAMADRSVALRTVNDFAATAPSWVELAWDHDGAPAHTVHLAARNGDAVAGQIANAFVAMVASGTRPQLRACLAPGCVLYFAKQHNRREWCSEGCGNRARVARHYQRQRNGVPGTPSTLRQ